MTKMKEDHETRAAIRITQTEIGLEKVRLQDAVDAAEKAAPFVHPRLASTTSRVGIDEPVQIKVQWQKEES